MTGLTDVDVSGARVIWLTEQLLAYAKTQRDAIEQGAIQRLDWLTLRIENLAAEIREAADRTRLNEPQVTRLKTLAREFELVRATSESALIRLQRERPEAPAATTAQMECGLGNTLHALGRYEEATGHYEAALALDAGLTEAHNNLGNSLQALGRYEEAVACYSRALAIDPGLADAQNNLGNALHAQHRSDEAITHFEAAIRLRPAFPEAHSNLGNALRALKRIDEAVAQYQAAIALRPAYPEAHNNLGNAWLALHRYEEAAACYRQALAIKPDYVIARNNLGTLLQELSLFEEALVEHETALSIQPDNVQTHQALALWHLQHGDAGVARQHARVGYAQPADRHPFRGPGQPIEVLVLQSALGGNVIADSWLDPARYQVTTFCTDFWQRGDPLPDHALIVNAIGEADRCPVALGAAAQLVARSGAPVINHPDRVLDTNRPGNARRLGQIAGVRTPAMRLYMREQLLAPDAPDRIAGDGFQWPLLLRPPGYHTGEHFACVESPADLRKAVEGLPGDRLFAIQFFDTRSADGKFRKFRVMAIGGQLLPLHLAISSNWKVHYFSADMTENARHRAEDARFLKDWRGVIGTTASEALSQIVQCVALDYFGIDFSISSQGELVVFEANATMVVPAPPRGRRWAYRRPATTAISRAIDGMLANKLAGAATPR